MRPGRLSGLGGSDSVLEKELSPCGAWVPLCALGPPIMGPVGLGLFCLLPSVFLEQAVKNMGAMEGSAEKPAAAALGTASQAGDKDLISMATRHRSNPLRPISEPTSSMQTSSQTKQTNQPTLPQVSAWPHFSLLSQSRPDSV